MSRKILLFAAAMLLIILSSSASASADSYEVNVNTSSIAGTTGSLDFNFNPGPLGATQAASLQILDFSSDGTLAVSPLSPMLTGDVSGSLPGVLTFDNGTPFNDYFQGFTYGSTLSFEISLFGPALSSPDGVSTSGSAFAFSMFSDPAGTIPVLTTDTTDGFAYVVTVNLDGTTTPTSYLTTPGTGGTGGGTGGTTGVPEPRTGMLTLAAILIAFAASWRQRATGAAAQG